MKSLIAAEWLKLRTTRLLYGMVPAAVLLSIAAVAGSVIATDRSDTTLDSTEGLRHVLSVTGTGALVVLIAGIFIAAGEQRHGTAGDTFLTEPRRERVVFAKLAVAAGIGVTVGVITALVSLGVAAALFNIKGVNFPVNDSDVWSILAGTLVYTTLFGVLGVALGTLIRNQVLAVALSLAWLAIVEHVLVNFVPSIGRWLPVAAGQAIVRTPLEDLLSPAAGALLLAAYSIVIGFTGIHVARTRDV